MRRLVVLSMLVGCGPAVSIDDDDDVMTDSGPSSTTSSNDGASGQSPADTTMGTGASTGDPFMDEDVHGQWLCEGDLEPFFMRIDEYTSPHQLMGTVCAPWNEVRDPTQWEPCSTLTSHPLGGGPELWIYAVITGSMAQMRQVDAVLVYDTAADMMEGFFAGPGVPPMSQVECTRIDSRA